MSISSNDYEIAFSREIPTKGFRWVDGPATREAPSGRFLSAGLSRFRKGPEDIKGSLFLDFSRLEVSEGTIKRFADREGFLGIESNVHTNPGSDHNDDLAGSEAKALPRGFLDYAASFDSWGEEIVYMRHARDLLDAIQERDAARLKEWLTIKPGKSVAFRGRGETKVTASFDSPRVKASRWLDAGRSILGVMINNKLTYGTQLSATHRGLYIKRTISVSSLLARMWMQLLDALDDGLIFHCEACGKMNVHKPRESGKRKPRDDRTLCYDEKTGRTSSKCKSLAHRQRGAKKTATANKGRQ